LGSGRLAAPRLRDPGAWSSWVEAAGPLDAAFAILRLACLLAVVYLAVVVLVGLAAQLSGARPLLRLSEAISLGLVRRVVHGSLGLGVAAGALVSTAGSLLAAAPAGAAEVTLARADPAPGAVTMRAGGRTRPAVTMRVTPQATMRAEPGPDALTMRAEPTATAITMSAEGPARPGPAMPAQPAPAPSPPAMRAQPAATGAGPTMRAEPASAPSGPVMRAEPAATEPTMQAPRATEPTLNLRAEPAPAPSTMHAGGGAPPVEMGPDIATDPGPVARAGEPGTIASVIPDAPVVAEPPTERILVPGDHLWSVAEQQVEAVLGRPGTDQEITRYWRRVVQVNRDGLADPSNPDLVFSGQVILLPPLPSR
jgi:hypothetical protein